MAVNNQLLKFIKHILRPGIYRLKHYFEEEIGYLSHATLTVWLSEWGYRVKVFHRNVEGTFNHSVNFKTPRKKPRQEPVQLAE